MENSRLKELLQLIINMGKRFNNPTLEKALAIVKIAVECLSEANSYQVGAQKQYITMCNDAFETMKKELEKEDLDEAERIAIFNSMTEIIKAYNQSNEKARKYANNIKIGLAIAGTTLTTFGIAYFGYQYYYNFKLNNPRII